MGSTISFLICYLFPHFITAGQISNQFVHQAQNWILSSAKYMSVKIWFSPLLVRIIEFIYAHVIQNIYVIFTIHSIYILFTFNSHLDYAQSMAVWCLNWWLVEMFEVLSKSWSQNLPRHLSKLKKMMIIEFSDYFLSHQIIHFIWSQNSFLWILKSFDCWHVSWIEYLEFWIFWYCFM